jgi:hypothetical protein
MNLKVINLILLSAAYLTILSTNTKSASLEGKWRSETDAVYMIAQRGSDVLALYEQPNKTQADAGIKSGDVAFTGSLMGNVLVATFYQRINIVEVPACSANWLRASTIYFELAPDSGTLTGDLLVDHVDDSCKIDKYSLQHLTLRRQ